jgi:ribonucleoside-diphosphate reductase alpha chain
MPCESSSVVTNSTNGMEPIRSLITVKKSKQGLLKMVAPEIKKLKNKYQLAYDLDGNNGINNIQAVIQKWIDQGISANHYYDFNKYEEGNLPISDVAKDILNFYKFGGKQIYYSNTNDRKTDDFSNISTQRFEENNNQNDEEEIVLKEGEVLLDDEDCAGGACSI